MAGAAQVAYGLRSRSHLAESGSSDDRAGGRTRLAEGTASFPARNVLAFLAEFIGTFLSSARFADFHAFVDGHGGRIVGRVTGNYVSIPCFDEDSSFYFDRARMIQLQHPAILVNWPARVPF